MPNIIEWKGCSPRWGARVFLAKGAHLIGDVELGDDCSLFFGAVLRADLQSIRVGARTNIQDNAVFHLSHERGIVVGEGCTIGHGAILHACTIGDNTMVGMGAIVMDGAKIGDNSLIAAGALIPPKKVFPSGSLIVGSPARRVRSLSVDEILRLKEAAELYIATKEELLRMGER